ncbi:MAG: hypothetical protein PHC51_06585 [bacterium]|nr:hypothetical protein [bacterium]
MTAHTTNKASQLGLKLSPENPLDAEFFVPHSGTITATELLETLFELCASRQKQFVFAYIYGPQGTGKSHLIATFIEQCKSVRPQAGYIEISTMRLPVIASESNTQAIEEWVPHFVSEYQRLLTQGGMLILEAECPPSTSSTNPHLRSRLLAACTAQVTYPSPQELHPLICSISERNNLKLSEKNLEYLLKRLPLRPLSFERIFARLFELSLERGVPAKQPLIRETLKSG